MSLAPGTGAWPSWRTANQAISIFSIIRLIFAFPQWSHKEFDLRRFLSYVWPDLLHLGTSGQKARALSSLFLKSANKRPSVIKMERRLYIDVVSLATHMTEIFASRILYANTTEMQRSKIDNMASVFLAILHYSRGPELNFYHIPYIYHIHTIYIPYISLNQILKKTQKNLLGR